MTSMKTFLVCVIFSVMSDSLKPHGLQPTWLLCLWNSLGENTKVGSHSLLQGIFPTQGQKLGLLHCRHIIYHLSHQGTLTGHISTPSSQLCGTLRATVNVKSTRGAGWMWSCTKSPQADSCQHFICLADPQKSPFVFISLKTPLVERALFPGYLLKTISKNYQTLQ